MEMKQVWAKVVTISELRVIWLAWVPHRAVLEYPSCKHLFYEDI